MCRSRCVKVNSKGPPEKQQLIRQLDQRFLAPLRRSKRGPDRQTADNGRDGSSKCIDMGQKMKIPNLGPSPRASYGYKSIVEHRRVKGAKEFSKLAWSI